MKHIFLLPFICLIGLWAGAQSGVGYDPENPGDPNVQYILRMEASPANAGNVSPKGMSKVEPGETVYCRANAKPGYRFVQWMSGENVLSTQDYLDFTMPDHNETLTARFEYTGYDPENPGDPAADGYRHYVRIYASPAQQPHIPPDRGENPTSLCLACHRLQVRGMAKQGGDCVSRQSYDSPHG